MNLEYARIPVFRRVNQAEYAIRIPMAVPQDHVNTYSTRRTGCLYSGKRARLGSDGTRVNTYTPMCISLRYVYIYIYIYIYIHTYTYIYIYIWRISRRHGSTPNETQIRDCARR